MEQPLVCYKGLTVSLHTTPSDQKKTFDPAAYFRFKSEKDVENQDAAEESQQARKLLEVRLDDIEKALMTLSIKDRLFLRESDAKSVSPELRIKPASRIASVSDTQVTLLLCFPNVLA